MLGFLHKNKSVDGDFIVELYRLYSTIVKKTIVSKLYSTSIDDIEDCVQEVFLVALKKIDQLRIHPKLIGWFTVTSKNIAMKYNEKFLRERCINDNAINDFPDTYSLDEQVVEDIMFSELVRQDVCEKVLNKLAYDEKRLYNLRWVEHLSYAEIEKRLELSQSAVKNRIMRLKQHIKSELKEYIE